jgi:hypothetical protein
LSDPTNVSANYYAGYCFYLAGAKPDAIKSFWRLAKAFPSRKEGIQARQYLVKIDPDFAKNDSSESKTSQVDGTQTTSSAKSSNVSKTASGTEHQATAREVVDSLVEVKRSIGKLANVSPAFIDTVKDVLVAVPLPILSFIKLKGGSVVVTPSVVEHDMRIQNTTPRGWTENFDWKSSPALTQGTQVVISQFRLDSQTNEYVDTTREIGVLRHELGQALDHCMGEFTQSADFKQAYYADAAAVPEEYKQKLNYFLQKSTSGPSETFAELFCFRSGGETDAPRKESCSLVHTYFPLCEKQMEKRLKQL